MIIRICAAYLFSAGNLWQESFSQLESKEENLAIVPTKNPK